MVGVNSFAVGCGWKGSVTGWPRTPHRFWAHRHRYDQKTTGDGCEVASDTTTLSGWTESSVEASRNRPMPLQKNAIRTSGTFCMMFHRGWGPPSEPTGPRPTRTTLAEIAPDTNVGPFPRNPACMPLTGLIEQKSFGSEVGIVRPGPRIRTSRIAVRSQDGIEFGMPPNKMTTVWRQENRHTSGDDRKVVLGKGFEPLKPYGKGS